MTLPRQLRHYRATDRGEVFYSWFSGANGSNGGNLGWVPRGIYGHHMAKIIDKALDLYPDRILVACNPDDHDQILGWACVEMRDDPVLHWVYVKKLFRGQGVARDLLSPLARPLVCSHWSIHCEQRSDLIYRPSTFYPRREAAS